jgi:hypothetical protein
MIQFLDGGFLIAASKNGHNKQVLILDFADSIDLSPQ